MFKVVKVYWALFVRKSWLHFVFEIQCNAAIPIEDILKICVLSLCFLPVLHCIPHDLPQVIVRFIFHKSQPKEIFKPRRKEC